MIGGSGFSDLPLYWQVIGVIGGVAFYGRFYVQWIVSELQKRSVFPMLFWYMSAVGSFVLLLFAAVSQSPNGALNHAFNIVVYARNLVLGWGEMGALSRARYYVTHAVIVAVVLLAVTLLVYTWGKEIHVTKAAPSSVLWLNWTLIGLGGLGSALFACRFLLQWLVSEASKKSVVPLAFWYLSIAASLLQLVPFLYRQEWVFAFGLLANLPVYARNLWLMHHHKEVAPE